MNVPSPKEGPNWGEEKNSKNLQMSLSKLPNVFVYACKIMYIVPLILCVGTHGVSEMIDIFVEIIKYISPSCQMNLSNLFIMNFVLLTLRFGTKRSV